MYRRIPIRQTMDFSVETLHARIEWGATEHYVNRNRSKSIAICLTYRWNLEEEGGEREEEVMYGHGSALNNTMLNNGNMLSRE